MTAVASEMLPTTDMHKQNSVWLCYLEWML